MLKKSVTKKHSLKTALVVAALAFCMLFSANTIYAKSVVKIGTIGSGDIWIDPDDTAAYVFKSLVETGTNGEIEVKVFPGMVLGQEREMMEMLKGGMIQMHMATAGSMGSFFPLYGVFDVPFLVPNYSVAFDVWDGWFGKKVDKLILEKTGLRSLGFYGQNGFYNLTNNKREIRTVKDMKGIKFRTMTLPSHIAFFEAMGASAIPMSWAELYTSLQTGVIDGQHNPVGYIISGKLYEVQKYMTISHHLYAVGFMLVNEQWFQSLPENHKQVVLDAAEAARVASRGINLVRSSTADKGLPFLKEHMDVYKPTPAELKTFADVAIPATRKYVEDTLGQEGIDLLNDYIKAVKESKKKLGYE